jgi:uncharacterized protein
MTPDWNAHLLPDAAMDYEWDETKRQANIRKHGIDFADAIKVFQDEFIETEDSRRDYGERRFRAIGEVDGVIMQVAYTWRGDRRRLISARRQDDVTEERITRVTLAQARNMKSLTDWDRVSSMTEEEIERNAAEDPDNPPMTDEEWASARVMVPVRLHLDAEVVDWFKSQADDYSARINDVLREFVEAQKQRG